MYLTGTIKQVTPRWILAAPGLLVAAYGRVTAAAHTVRRVAPVVRLSGAISTAAGCVRRVVPALTLSARISAIARRGRRVVSDVVAGAAQCAAIARRARRGVAESTPALGSITIVTGARAKSTLLWADGTAAGWGDGTEIQIYR
ncbi:hypothetical protein [Opitutus terrae]|uniref:Uncharacterized protein n=1 Tax=Opitutus terrae (strain DSM 11246 / JCM 15787 / PB90-1) TaxID=452637 RepID=B1ZV39_OPITP|nr:hypothetical protein [Opitutus terrae]ACB76706.1 hypothetical protein Oter_3429 [Opitutus terrae PB90-1]